MGKGGNECNRSSAHFLAFVKALMKNYFQKKKIKNKIKIDFVLATEKSCKDEGKYETLYSN